MFICQTGVSGIVSYSTETGIRSRFRSYPFDGLCKTTTPYGGSSRMSAGRFGCQLFHLGGNLQHPFYRAYGFVGNTLVHFDDRPFIAQCIVEFLQGVQTHVCALVA